MRGKLHTLHLQILDMKQFYTEDWQILGATEESSVNQVTWHPCVMESVGLLPCSQQLSIWAHPRDNSLQFDFHSLFLKDPS
jgi:hypothetical protein